MTEVDKRKVVIGDMAAEGIRLNKYLAECGICSRRDADKLIEEGRVTVNGQKASMGVRVTGKEKIAVNGKIIQSLNDKKVLAYYKPVGVTCTEKDKYAKKTISDALKYPVRVTYAGRLDKDSEGLMIMTNDGELIDRMMRGANRHEKEYVVKVNKEITVEFLEDMAKGVWLKELEKKTRPCEIEKLGKYTFRIILTQGLNRQIRRMCQAFGYEVQSLKRIRVMNVCLNDLKPGQYREVTAEELEILYRSVGMETD